MGCSKWGRFPIMYLAAGRHYNPSGKEVWILSLRLNWGMFFLPFCFVFFGGLWPHFAERDSRDPFPSCKVEVLNNNLWFPLFSSLLFEDWRGRFPFFPGNGSPFHSPTTRSPPKVGGDESVSSLSSFPLNFHESRTV